MGNLLIRLEEKIRRLKLDQAAHKEWLELRRLLESKGGKWVAENGTIFELRDGAIYQYLRDGEEGVTNMIVTNLDARTPYVAELDVDLQGIPPGKRLALLDELDVLSRRKSIPEVEIVTIVAQDWLSKISLARWGTINWKRHLEPTKITLAARKVKGREFNPDLIYPGDTFSVIP